MPISVNVQNVLPRKLADFGVEVTRTIETAGEVYATETQGGEAAVAVHHGHSWEIYGDPTPDPAHTETTG
jgi:hypothetical protein